MLLPFQPNIPEQTLASAVCVCQYIYDYEYFKDKIEFAFWNIRHFEGEPVFWIHSKASFSAM